MPETGSRRELRKFSPAIYRRLTAQGYKIERRYVNFPTVAELWSAVERDEPIWVYQCWVIVRKTRQRLKPAREAPTEKGRSPTSATEEGGMNPDPGGEKP
jgi:hypothetical protein